MANVSEATNLSNWREAPYNQWAFVNVDKVVRTHSIKSPDNARELPSSAFDFKNIAISGKANRLTCRPLSKSPRPIILHHGKVVHEQYSRGNTKDSKHIMMSMTKSITGLLVGILQDQGRLHADDQVIKHVPEIKGTIYENYSDNKHEYRCATGWNPEDGTEKYTNIHDFIANFNPARAKHDGFEYVSVNTDLIGWVIERATGKKFAGAIEDLLWKPMGAENDALMTVDKEGNARAAGGMAATLRDIARVGQLIAEYGKGDKEAFAKGSWSAGLNRFFGGGLAYRSYCMADSSSDQVMCLGIFGQQMMVDRKNGIVTAKTGSQAQSLG